MGDKTTANKKVPTASTAVKKQILQVATGYFHTCVIIADKNLQCWGYNQQGQDGNDTGAVKTNPTGLNIDSGWAVKQVACGAYHTCAILEMIVCTAGDGVIMGE